MQVWTVLHVARWKYRTQKWRKNRHLGTIANFVGLYLCNSGMYRQSEKNLLSSNTFSTCHRNMVNFGTNGWDRFVSLGHPSKFQLVSRLGSVTAQHSSRGRQPNFVALNTGRHLYSAGRPSRWALAHTLVLMNIWRRYHNERSALHQAYCSWRYCVCKTALLVERMYM